VVEELTEKCRARGHLVDVLVAIPWAEFWVIDEPDRTLVQRIRGIQQSTRLANINHCISDRLGARISKSGKLEHSAESGVRRRRGHRPFNFLGMRFHII
jgi:hypothetical protein